MKKAFKLIGTVMLAAGVSFAVSSCEKETAAVPENDVIEETVDFEEITKSDLEDIQNATEQTKGAIYAIVRGFTGWYDGAKQAHEEFVSKLESALLDMFTCAFKGERSTTVDIGDVFHEVLEIIVNHEGFGDGQVLSKNEVTVTRTSGLIHFETPDGYYLNIGIPDWKAYIGDGAKDFTFTDGLKYSVETGKGNVMYSYVQYTFVDRKSATAEVKLFYEGREIGAAYDFCPYTWIMDYDSLEIWFTNLWANKTAEGGYNLDATSDICFKNLDDVFWSLTMITRDTYSYTSEDARKIVDGFN